MFKRLQTKLAIIYISLLIIVLLTSNTLIYTLLESSNTKRLSSEIDQMLSEIKGFQWLKESSDDSESSDHEKSDEEDEDDEYDYDYIVKTEELIVPNSIQGYEYYRIYTSENKLLFSKSPDKIVGSILNSYIDNLKSNGDTEIVDLEDEGLGHYIMARTVIVINGDYYGYAIVGQNVTLAYDTIDQLLNIMLIVTGIGVLLSLVLGYYLSGKAIKPVKEAYKIKERFIGDASHELRTPISIIQLSMDVIKRESDKLSDIANETIKDVSDEVKNMGKLVEKLLFIARNDSNSLVIDEEKIDLNQMIQRICNSHQKLANDKSISIINRFNEKVVINGDSKLLDSVFSTILDNSVKYNKINGEVLVDFKFNESKSKKVVEIIIRDTGIGIPEEHKEKVFERFYRQNSSRSKHISGYGLGLSIAKDIILAHGGRIDLKSELGEYTEIRILLPLASQK